MTEPYYKDDLAVIYHGDASRVMANDLEFDSFDCVVTDPVWPNATVDLQGSDDPVKLFAESAHAFGFFAKRCAIHLGCDSDPRILRPIAMDFFRCVNLEYARPHYKGRLLYTNDVAYLFGEPPKSEKGHHIISGRCISTASTGKETNHPCPRKLEHVEWLVDRWARGSVLDPFMGSGTTLVAAKRLGYPAVGIEIEERYCEMAADRLSSMSPQFLFATPGQDGQPHDRSH